MKRGRFLKNTGNFKKFGPLQKNETSLSLPHPDHCSSFYFDIWRETIYYTLMEVSKFGPGVWFLYFTLLKRNSCKQHLVWRIKQTQKHLIEFYWSITYSQIVWNSLNWVSNDASKPHHLVTAWQEYFRSISSARLGVFCYAFIRIVNVFRLESVNEG